MRMMNQSNTENNPSFSQVTSRNSRQPKAQQQPISAASVQENNHNTNTSVVRTPTLGQPSRQADNHAPAYNPHEHTRVPVHKGAPSAWAVKYADGRIFDIKCDWGRGFILDLAQTSFDQERALDVVRGLYVSICERAKSEQVRVGFFCVCLFVSGMYDMRVCAYMH